MRVGLLVTGDTSVRAAHSLQAHPEIDQIVVIGPATSKSFSVVDEATGCDFLVGAGPDAPALAAKQGVGLVWDGLEAHPAVSVWGASPHGIALALASREPDPRLVALAHPECDTARGDAEVRFPDPVGRVGIADGSIDGRPLALGKSTNDFAACLVEGAERRVAVVDNAAFMSGIALAAGVLVAAGVARPVWTDPLTYLEAATEMGLVMAESG